MDEKNTTPTPAEGAANPMGDTAPTTPAGDQTAPAAPEGDAPAA